MKEFKIKFITPLLLHGAYNNRPDAHGLAKALRGAWRFWFRAIVGGLVPGITKENLSAIESDIFGSADEKIGARFRMIATSEVTPKVDNNIPTGFNRGQFKGYKEGTSFKITILPRKVKSSGMAVFFSKMTRGFLRFVRVSSREELAERIQKYLEEVNATPVVFRWKYKMDEIRV